MLAFSEPFFFSDEYLDYLSKDLQYDSRGRCISFKGEKYCKSDDECRCNKCRERRKFKNWPYDRSLSFALYHIISGRLYFNYKNDREFIKYENGLLIDYEKDLAQFKKYVENVCMMSNEFGTLILNDFNSGKYRKRP